MPQDKESGLRASRFGKDCARRIAAAIGARMLGAKSNECFWKDEGAIIKCAGKRGVNFLADATELQRQIKVGNFVGHFAYENIPFTPF